MGQAGAGRLPASPALGGAGAFLLLGKLGVYDFTLADAAEAVDEPDLRALMRSFAPREFRRATRHQP